MYLFAILTSLICLQLVSIAASDTNDIPPSQQLNHLLNSETMLDNEDISNSDSENDEEKDYAPRSTTFLRFGREISPPTGSFLRFGRSDPTFLRFGRSGHDGAAFLRFGRRAEQPSTSNFLRFGRRAERQQLPTGNFLRFGRRAEQQRPSTGNFLRFGRKGEFLRFG